MDLQSKGEPASLVDGSCSRRLALHGSRRFDSFEFPKDRVDYTGGLDTGDAIFIITIRYVE
jgi:hypothetical protein